MGQEHIPVAVPVVSEVRYLGMAEHRTALAVKHMDGAGTSSNDNGGLDFSAILEGSLLSDASASDKKQAGIRSAGGPCAPSFCQRPWHMPDFNPFPAYRDMPLAYVVTIDDALVGENIASILSSAVVQDWVPDPPAQAHMAVAHQDIVLNGRPVRVQVTETEADQRLNVHLTLSVKDEAGGQRGWRTDYFNVNQLPSSLTNNAVIMSGGSASFEDCVFDQQGQDGSGSVIMNNVDVTFKDCIFSKSADSSMDSLDARLPSPSKSRRMTITRGLELRGKRVLASVYDQDGSIGVHVFLPLDVETYATELQPSAWAALGYKADTSDMTQQERMQLYNAVFKGLELVPLTPPADGERHQQYQETSFRLNVRLAPADASVPAVASEPAQIVGLLGGEEEEEADDHESVASIESMPGFFPMAITRGVKVSGRKLLCTLFESKRDNQLHVQAFDPLNMNTYTADFSSRTWVEAGYPERLQEMLFDEKKRLYNTLFAALRLVPAGKGSKRALTATLPSIPGARLGRAAEGDEEEAGSVDSERGPLSVTRGLVINRKRMLATIFEDVRAGKLEAHVFDPAEVLNYRADVYPDQWQHYGFPADLRALAEADRMRLYNGIFAGIQLVPDGGQQQQPGGRERPVVLRLVVDLDLSVVPAEQAGQRWAARGSPSGGLQKLRTCSLTRGQRVSGRPMLLTVFENGSKGGGSSLTVEAFDHVSVKSYTATVSDAHWAAAGYGPKLSVMNELERCRLLTAVLSSCYLVLDPEAVPLDYKIEVHLDKVSRRGGGSPPEADTEATSGGGNEVFKMESLRGSGPRSVTRGVKLKGRNLLVREGQSVAPDDPLHVGPAG